jgi:hypothetical protein
MYIAGKHPFLNPNGNPDLPKQLNGEYEKAEKGKYSDILITLMERMMNVVCVCVW